MKIICEVVTHDPDRILHFECEKAETAYDEIRFCISGCKGELKWEFYISREDLVKIGKAYA